MPVCIISEFSLVYDAEAYFFCQKEAIKWYEKAANQGDIEAQFYLGHMYEERKGVEKNLEKAMYWFEKAANQGNIYAQIFLGHMYEEGKGIEKNLEKAMYWFEKAKTQDIKKFFKYKKFFNDSK